MNCSLVELFALLDVPENRGGASFGASADFAVIDGMYSSAGLDLSYLPAAARRLYELSVNAFDALVHGWMSGLPIKSNLIRFGRKVLNTANRAAADRAATDRGDPDVRLILDTSFKVCREIDRMRGLLRFSPGEDGLYAAYCTPDYFILPALAEHFTLRFGDTPWVIIDQKRSLRLSRSAGKAPALDYMEAPVFQNQPVQPDSDEWEQLWQSYHRTINNESRNNPNLQRNFMPKRYWGHLPEMRGKTEV